MASTASTEDMCSQGIKQRQGFYHILPGNIRKSWLGLAEYPYTCLRRDHIATDEGVFSNHLRVFAQQIHASWVLKGWPPAQHEQLWQSNPVMHVSGSPRLSRARDFLWKSVTSYSHTSIGDSTTPKPLGHPNFTDPYRGERPTSISSLHHQSQRNDMSWFWWSQEASTRSWRSLCTS